MKSARFWIAVAASGVVMNIADFLGQGLVMTSMYYAKHPETFVTTTTNPLWFIFGDFVTIFVLAWVFAKVAASFNAGWSGGAMYGLYAGVLVNFPTWIMAHLMVKGISYKFAWFSTIYGIAWTVIAGAILGAIYPKKTSSPQ